MRISHPSKKIHARIQIPASKSESNRALILNALTNNQLQIQNLSTARDTQNLMQILSKNSGEVNVLDAGTSMRFLTAYYAAICSHKIVTGNEEMKKRPIGVLVNALCEMGFDIRCLETEGFPPLEIHPVGLDKIESEVWIAGNISSQYITALLLIAPFLPNGLKINVSTEINSEPYVDMTINMLQYIGVEVTKEKGYITISPLGTKINSPYVVGGDWSSASYWYSLAFLAEEAEIFLEGLRNDWNQGDQEISVWMKRFGIHTGYNAEGAIITKVKSKYPTLLKMNLKHTPDLAQTFAVMFAAKNICCAFSGLESLKIKETDRISALQHELQKVNTQFEYAAMYEFWQLKGDFKFPTSPIKTYNDHRMAMSFAPLAMLGDIQIENPEVVEKSYPDFWKDLEKAGFHIS